MIFRGDKLLYGFKPGPLRARRARLQGRPLASAFGWARTCPEHEWADGTPWEIRRGGDYYVATENMRVSLHMKAKQLFCKVQSRKFTDARRCGTGVPVPVP